MTEFDESAFDDSLDDLFSDLDRNADDQAQRLAGFHECIMKCGHSRYRRRLGIILII